MTITDVTDNLNDPNKLAGLYFDDPQAFEVLKLKYPSWKFLARMYNPKLLPALKALGVPI